MCKNTFVVLYVSPSAAHTEDVRLFTKALVLLVKLIFSPLFFFESL